jgi:hypothetical protein
MKFRKSLLAALCVVSLGGALNAPMASAAVSVYLDVAPPPPRYEAAPPPRRGYVWAPGYWNARNHHHVWQAGHWERERRGYHYNQSTWVEHDNRWQLEKGHWKKGDRDGDGVPNSADRAPDNPRRN